MEPEQAILPDRKQSRVASLALRHRRADEPFGAFIVMLTLAIASMQIFLLLHSLN